MTDTRSLEDRLTDVALIERALNRAVREALLRHKQADNPIAIWRDGQIVHLAPDDILVGRKPDEDCSPSPPSGAHLCSRRCIFVRAFACVFSSLSQHESSMNVR